MLFTSLPIVTSFNDEHFLKTPSPIAFFPLGIFIFSRLSQFSNVQSPKKPVPSLSSTSFSFLQPENVLYPISVFPGIEIFVNLLHPKKA